MVTNIRYSIPLDANNLSVSKNNESLEHIKYARTQMDEVSNSLAEDKVSISKAAISAYRDKQAENTSSSSTSSIENSISDKNIENIKKQIEALKQEINQIKYDKSKDSQRTKKMLQFQLNALSASLMDLLGKKLSAL